MLSARNRPQETRERLQIRSSSSSSDDDQSIKYDDSDYVEEYDENECVGCGENYNETQREDDWIQCIMCERWLHEGCSKYENVCDLSGKVFKYN